MRAFRASSAGVSISSDVDNWIVRRYSVRMSNPTQLTTSQAAKVLGVSRTTVPNLVRRGVLVPVARIDVAHHGAFLFDRDEVERLAAARKEARTA